MHHNNKEKGSDRRENNAAQLSSLFHVVPLYAISLSLCGSLGTLSSPPSFSHSLCFSLFFLLYIILNFPYIFCTCVLVCQFSLFFLKRKSFCCVVVVRGMCIINNSCGTIRVMNHDRVVAMVGRQNDVSRRKQLSGREYNPSLVYNFHIVAIAFFSQLTAAVPARSRFSLFELSSLQLVRRFVSLLRK